MRILRINPEDPNKTGVMINLVIEPFMWEEKLITPCDNTWIHIGLRTLDYEFLTIEKLEKTIKDETNRIFKG